MASISTLLVASRDSSLQQLRPQLMCDGAVKLLSDPPPDVDPARLVRAWRPDVLLLDGGSYGAGTIAMLDRIQAISPATKTLVFLRMLSDQYVVRALNHGATGCLRIGTPPQQVASAIRAVHSGEFWAARKTLAQAFRKALAINVHTELEYEASSVRLSTRELQIVAWMRRGMTNKEIARELGISDTTVKTHAHNIFHKTSTSGRVRLLQKLQPSRDRVLHANGKDTLRAVQGPAPVLGTA